MAGGSFLSFSLGPLAALDHGKGGSSGEEENLLWASVAVFGMEKQFGAKEEGDSLSLRGFWVFRYPGGRKKGKKRRGSRKERKTASSLVGPSSPPQQPPPSHRSQEVRTKPALSFPEGPFLHSKGEVGHAKGKTRRGTNENIVEKVDRRRGRKRDRGGGEKYRAGCRFCSLLRYSFAGGRRRENAATQKGASRQKCRKGTVLTICHQTPVRSFARGGDVPFLPDEKERGGVGVGETS